MRILRMGITKNAYAVVEDGSARRLAPALHYPTLVVSILLSIIYIITSVLYIGICCRSKYKRGEVGG